MLNSDVLPSHNSNSQEDDANSPEQKSERANHAYYHTYKHIHVNNDCTVH